MIQDNVLVLNGHTGRLQFAKSRDDALRRQIASRIVVLTNHDDAGMRALGFITKACNSQ